MSILFLFFIHFSPTSSTVKELGLILARGCGFCSVGAGASPNSAVGK